MTDAMDAECGQLDCAIMGDSPRLKKEGVTWMACKLLHCFFRLWTVEQS